MTKRSLRLLTVLLSVVTVACVLNQKDALKPLDAVPKGQTTQGLSLEIPNARWEPMFFEALEERTNKAGLSNLRKVILPDHDLELRFWYDHFEVIQGVIIRRSGDKWSRHVS
jgi:hypothetical protein